MADEKVSSNVRSAVEAWMKEQWARIPATPLSQPGSYNRGYDMGMTDILRGLKVTLDKCSAVETKPQAPLCDGTVRVIYKQGEPEGVRDDSGFLCFFNRVSKYAGQEERYRDELALRARQADVIAQALSNAVNGSLSQEQK